MSLYMLFVPRHKIQLFISSHLYTTLLTSTDSECAQYKAENVILRRERDTLTQELRRAKGTAEFSGDRLSSTESEARRLKSQAQVSFCWYVRSVFACVQFAGSVFNVFNVCVFCLCVRCRYVCM